MNIEPNTSPKPSLLSFAEQQEAQIASSKLVLATTKEICKQFSLDESHSRTVFKEARIRAGTPRKPSLYDRAMVCEILSQMNGREIGYPVEPLLNQAQAIRLLNELGTPRKKGTFRRLEEQEILIPIRIHTALRYRPKDVIEASKSLKRWSRV